MRVMFAEMAATRRWRRSEDWPCCADLKAFVHRYNTRFLLLCVVHPFVCELRIYLSHVLNVYVHNIFCDIVSLLMSDSWSLGSYTSCRCTWRVWESVYVHRPLVLLWRVHTRSSRSLLGRCSRGALAGPSCVQFTDQGRIEISRDPRVIQNCDRTRLNKSYNCVCIIYI